MLVISRRTGEGVHIGDGTRVTVVSVQGGKVRLGIEAPKSVRVLRDEIYPGKQEASHGDDQQG